MKKVLALVVAFALCFTALAGCFVTSAEDAVELTFVNTAVASEGDAAIVVAADLGDAAKYAARTTITVDAAFEFVGLAGLTQYDEEAEAAADDAGEDYDFDYTVETTEDATVVKALNAFDNGALSYTIELVAPANATCQDVDYEDAISVEVEYAAFDATAATTVKGATAVTVAAGAGHTYGEGVVDPDATCTEEGVITYTCACGHSYTEAISPKGHTAGEAKEENRVEATLEAPGSYDMVVRCTVCNAVMSTETFEIPQLKPEGPTVDASLTFASVSPGFGTSSLQVSFRVNNSVLDSYADMELVIIPVKYDASFNLVEDPEEIVINKANLVKAGSTRKQYVHTDINLYEIGLDINYMLRAYDAQGNLVAVSETFTTSVVSYLKNLAANSPDNAELQTVVADLLIVGDRAADYFGEEGSDLANAASLTEGYDISAATPGIESYNQVADLVSSNSDFGTANTAKHQVRTSVQVGKAPFINFRIGDQGKVLDFNKLVINVSYTSSAGSEYKPFTFTGNDFNYAGKYINLTFDQIGLHDGDRDILFTVIYDGVEMCTYTYSVETYLGANLTSATLGDLADALIKLGNSFRAYNS